MEETQFDECDLNHLLDCVRHRLEHTDWDVLHEDSWRQLKSLKELQTRLERALDDAFDDARS